MTNHEHPSSITNYNNHLPQLLNLLMRESFRNLHASIGSKRKKRDMRPSSQTGTPTSISPNNITNRIKRRTNQLDQIGMRNPIVASCGLVLKLSSSLSLLAISISLILLIVTPLLIECKPSHQSTRTSQQEDSNSNESFEIKQLIKKSLDETNLPRNGDSSYQINSQLQSSNTQSQQQNVSSSNSLNTINFQCPEQFGYYTDTRDCTKYYVCVFGEVLHESCTGGLRFSRELQTCDWPRNVDCPQSNSTNTSSNSPSTTSLTSPSDQRTLSTTSSTSLLKSTTSGLSPATESPNNQAEERQPLKSSAALVFADEGSDPQQPAFDEAVSPVITADGAIHLHDGSGGTFSLSGQNPPSQQQQQQQHMRPTGSGPNSNGPVDVFVKPLQMSGNTRRTGQQSQLANQRASQGRQPEQRTGHQSIQQPRQNINTRNQFVGDTGSGPQDGSESSESDSGGDDTGATTSTLNDSDQLDFNNPSGNNNEQDGNINGNDNNNGAENQEAPDGKSHLMMNDDSSNLQTATGRYVPPVPQAAGSGVIQDSHLSRQSLQQPQLGSVSMTTGRQQSSPMLSIGSQLISDSRQSSFKPILLTPGLQSQTSGSGFRINNLIVPNNDDRNNNNQFQANQRGQLLANRPNNLAMPSANDNGDINNNNNNNNNGNSNEDEDDTNSDNSQDTQLGSSRSPLRASVGVGRNVTTPASLISAGGNNRQSRMSTSTSTSSNSFQPQFGPQPIRNPLQMINSNPPTQSRNFPPAGHLVPVQKPTGQVLHPTTSGRHFSLISDLDQQSFSNGNNNFNNSSKLIRLPTSQFDNSNNNNNNNNNNNMNGQNDQAISHQLGGQNHQSLLHSHPPSAISAQSQNQFPSPRSQNVLFSQQPFGLIQDTTSGARIPQQQQQQSQHQGSLPMQQEHQQSSPPVGQPQQRRPRPPKRQQIPMGSSRALGQSTSRAGPTTLANPSTLLGELEFPATVATTSAGGFNGLPDELGGSNQEEPGTPIGAGTVTPGSQLQRGIGVSQFPVPSSSSNARPRPLVSSTTVNFQDSDTFPVSQNGGSFATPPTSVQNIIQNSRSRFSPKHSNANSNGNSNSNSNNNNNDIHLSSVQPLGPTATTARQQQLQVQGQRNTMSNPHGQLVGTESPVSSLVGLQHQTNPLVANVASGGNNLNPSTTIASVSGSLESGAQLGSNDQLGGQQQAQSQAQQQDPAGSANRYLNSVPGDALEAGQPFGAVDYDFDILNDNSTDRRNPSSLTSSHRQQQQQQQQPRQPQQTGLANDLGANTGGSQALNGTSTSASFNSNGLHHLNANLRQRQQQQPQQQQLNGVAGNEALANQANVGRLRGSQRQQQQQQQQASQQFSPPAGGNNNSNQMQKPQQQDSFNSATNSQTNGQSNSFSSSPSSLANGATLSSQQQPQQPIKKPRPTNKKISVNHEQAIANNRASIEPAKRPEAIFPLPQMALQTATKCDNRVCRLPDCKCGDTLTPGQLESKVIPQIVLLTFDDAVNDLNWEIYEELFTGRTNPNGCPILATFYVSHEWTDYGQVQTLYSRGHEMASHSITHSFGEKFSKSQWFKEVNGQREILNMYGGVKMSDVRGMRAPFLQIGGNKMFEMLYDANFTYDSSMPIFENSPPMWPYTLDYQLSHECMITPCPTKSFPGVWEVGMTMWVDLRGGRCSMGDACSNPADEEGVYEMLMKNFNRHYKSNRAPFGLFYHSAWFNTVHHRRGFLKFLSTVNSLPDVFFTTNWQMLQWMRQPTPLNEINSFEPWQCPAKNDRPPPCFHPSVCNVKSEHGTRFMKTCQPCPTNQQYPWVGSTGFKSKQQSGSGR